MGCVSVVLRERKKGRKSRDKAAGQRSLPLGSLLLLFVFDSPFPFSVHDQVGVTAWQGSVLLHLMRNGWWGMDVVAVWGWVEVAEGFPKLGC